MRDTKSPGSERCTNPLSCSADDNVSAVIIEEPQLVERMLAEGGRRDCDRCFHPGQKITGMVFFWATPPRILVHLGRSDWALCRACLQSLKRAGIQQPVGNSPWEN